MTSFLDLRRGFVWPYPHAGLESFTYGNHQYFGYATSAPGGVEAYESPPSGFVELVQGPFKTNPIVFSCELRRIQVFAEAQFIWQGYNKGRAGNLFGTPELDILRQPWPRGSTGDLIANMVMYADLGGTAFVYRNQEDVGSAQDRLRVLRPDYVTIIMGSASGEPVDTAAQIDAEIIGFIYDPQDGRTEAEPLLASEVAMWAPVPDPLARFRGMPWLTPAVRDTQADQAATLHKLMFFENGASPQLVMSFDPEITQEQFQGYVAKMDAKHSGWRNAYRTLYIGGGAKPTVVGKDLQQLDFSNTQGKGETRIIGAAGLHPVLVPASEGMQGSSLNAGNYQAARDAVADMTFRPGWQGICAALETICPPPNSGSRLWYDEDAIPFLREDSKKAAEVEHQKQITIVGYVREGFTPKSAIAAVAARDVSLLEHTGLVSVQLQKPGAMDAPPADGAPIPATVKPPAQLSAGRADLDDDELERKGPKLAKGHGGKGVGAGHGGSEVGHPFHGNQYVHVGGPHTADSGGHTKTGMTLTDLGRAGERLFVANQARSGITKMFGRVSETAKTAQGQNPIDLVSRSHAIELKTIDARSKRLKVGIKAHEVAQKEAAAKAMGKQGAVVAQIYDAHTGTMHVYAHPDGFRPAGQQSGSYELSGHRTGKPVKMKRVGSYKVSGADLTAALGRSVSVLDSEDDWAEGDVLIAFEPDGEDWTASIAVIAAADDAERARKLKAGAGKGGGHHATPGHNAGNEVGHPFHGNQYVKTGLSNKDASPWKPSMSAKDADAYVKAHGSTITGPMFHGTTHGHEAIAQHGFDFSKSGSATGNTGLGGAYLTANHQYAEAYVHSGGKVLETRVLVKNPLGIDGVRDIMREHNLILDHAGRQKIAQIARSRGHDAIHIGHGTATDELTVFRKEQIVVVR